MRKNMGVLLTGAIFAFLLCASAFAAPSGIGAVAGSVTGNLGNIARLITAAAYVAGMGFAVGAIVKFKAAKDMPQQNPIGTPIVFLFVAAALLFAPSVFRVSGKTMGLSGIAGVSGTVSF